MRVELQAPDWATHLLSDRTDWRRAPLPVAELAPFDLPDDAYFEYAWQDAAGEKHPDPGNPNPGRNPWWTFASNLAGPGYRRDPDAAACAGPGRPAGRVLRLSVPSESLGRERRCLVYSPPGRADEKLPHILFQDGKAYYGWGRAPRIYDRLLARGEVGPAHLVFVPPVNRTEEYAYNERYRRFLTEELLPVVDGRAPCNGHRTAWGASLGGLLSAELAWRRPDLFGRVVAQSGAFLFSPDMDLGNPFQGGEDLLQRVRSETCPDVAWHLQCGTLEWLEASNRNLAAALGDRGAAVELVLRNAGHNWVNWGDGIAAGLRFALSA